MAFFLKEQLPPSSAFPLAENLELFCKRSRKDVFFFFKLQLLQNNSVWAKAAFMTQVWALFFFFLVLPFPASTSELEERKSQCCFCLCKSFLQSSVVFHDFRASVLNGMEEIYLAFKKIFFSDFENVKQNSKSLFLRFVKGFLIPWIYLDWR